MMGVKMSTATYVVLVDYFHLLGSLQETQKGGMRQTISMLMRTHFEYGMVGCISCQLGAQKPAFETHMQILDWPLD